MNKAERLREKPTSLISRHPLRFFCLLCLSLLYPTRFFQVNHSHSSALLCSSSVNLHYSLHRLPCWSRLHPLHPHIPVTRMAAISQCRRLRYVIPTVNYMTSPDQTSSHSARPAGARIPIMATQDAVFISPLPAGSSSTSETALPPLPDGFRARL